MVRLDRFNIQSLNKLCYFLAYVFRHVKNDRIVKAEKKKLSTEPKLNALQAKHWRVQLRWSKLHGSANKFKINSVTVLDAKRQRTQWRNNTNEQQKDA